MPKPYKVTPEHVSKSMNILVYGKPGVGKTAFAGGAQDHPDLQDVLVCNTEGGLITLASRRDIQAVDISDTDELSEMFWGIANKEEGYENIKTVIVDSASELQAANLENIMQGRLKKDSKQNPNLMTQQDYLQSNTNLNRVFRWIRDLELTVIFTALLREVTERDGTEVVAIKPALTRGLSDALMGYVDFVWCLYTEDNDDGGVDRVLITRETGLIQAKTRGMKFSEALGNEVRNPTLAEIYQLYKETEGVK